MENAALVALLRCVCAVQVWSASMPCSAGAATEINFCRNCSGMRLKPRLRGCFVPGDRLCSRRDSVHAGGRPARL